ncbi:hypothetical protein ACQ4PT_001908 [Festuca glaucescens]
MSPPTQWSDLPVELLHLVCAKVVGTLRRTRFAAVCKSWRAAAIASRQAAPPALPWLIFSSYKNKDDGKTRRLYCPEDDEVLPIALPSEVFGGFLMGAHDGGWVATLEPNLRFAVVNLFSGIEVALSEKQRRPACIIRKVVFSEPPTSSGCFLAAITHDWGIALCRVGCPEDGWTIKQLGGAGLVDIAFYNGELYGLTGRADLVRFEIDVNTHGMAVVTGDPQWLSIRKGSSSSLGHPRYIFELHGKLTMAVRNCWSHDQRHNKELFFKVFQLADEAVASSQYNYKWGELRSLGDYALFVGHKWSKAVYVAAEERGLVQRNCIYADDVLYLASLDSHGNRAYEMQHERDSSGLPTIKSVGSRIVGGPPGGMWVLPPNF